MLEIAYSASKGNRLGFGTMREWANYPGNSAQYLALGDHLFDQLPNPFNGLVPATAAESGATISRWELLSPHPEFFYIAPRPGPPWGNSIYHSGCVQFTKLLSQGVQLDASYAYSKLISDSDSADDPNVDWLAGAINANSGGRARTQDWANLRASDRAASILDITHRLVLDFSYQLPIGRDKALGKNWGRGLDIGLGGWQVNGFMTITSGVPLLPHLASPSFLDTYRQRPDVLPGVSVVNSGPVVSKVDNYLNPAAFCPNPANPVCSVNGNPLPLPFTFGTAPRTMSYARAPGFHGADISLFKLFYLSHEKQMYFQLRAEAFDVTNTPIFSVPGTTYSAGDFGIITA